MNISEFACWERFDGKEFRKTGIKATKMFYMDEGRMQFFFELKKGSYYPNYSHSIMGLDFTKTNNGTLICFESIDDEFEFGEGSQYVRDKRSIGEFYELMMKINYNKFRNIKSFKDCWDLLGVENV